MMLNSSFSTLNLISIIFYNPLLLIPSNSNLSKTSTLHTTLHSFCSFPWYHTLQKYLIKTALGDDDPDVII